MSKQAKLTDNGSASSSTGKDGKAGGKGTDSLTDEVKMLANAVGGGAKSLTACDSENSLESQARQVEEKSKFSKTNVGAVDDESDSDSEIDHDFDEGRPVDHVNSAVEIDDDGEGKKLLP